MAALEVTRGVEPAAIEAVGGHRTASRPLRKSLGIDAGLVETYRRLGAGIVSRGIEWSAAHFGRLTALEVEQALGTVDAKGRRQEGGDSVKRITVSMNQATAQALLKVGAGSLDAGATKVAVVMEARRSLGFPVTGVSRPQRDKRPRGRPRYDVACRQIKKSISLYPKVVQFLRESGGGVLSHGIEQAAELYARLSIDEVATALRHKPSGLIDIEVEKMSVSMRQSTFALLIVLGDGTLSQGVKQAAEVAMGHAIAVKVGGGNARC